jgi:hypothetical protein
VDGTFPLSLGERAQVLAAASEKEMKIGEPGAGYRLDQAVGKSKLEASEDRIEERKKKAAADARQLSLDLFRRIEDVGGTERGPGGVDQGRWERRRREIRLHARETAEELVKFGGVDIIGREV